ncbi:hypothetical protein [Streptomyces sp. NPDC057002]|uniref:hypothetical protein n=1 Tax=Streptomyces sp. NPDC057002 TaxID=3345992 RepID=UPI00363A9474
MSYAPQRSLTGDLEEGLTDCGYKKVNRDRGGQVDPATYNARRNLNDLWFGIHEAPVKHRPDGLTTRTPGYVATPNPYRPGL